MSAKLASVVVGIAGFMGSMAGTLFAAEQGKPAASFTWTSPAAGNWSDGAKWNPATAPVATGGADHNLIFSQAGTYTVTNDLNEGFLLNTLTLGAPDLTLAGKGVAFNANGGALPQIIKNGDSGVTISLPINLLANLSCSGTGKGVIDKGELILSGVISGPGSLTMDGAGYRLRLVADNTYSGGTIINVGAIALGTSANTLLGTGAVTVNSPARLDLNGNGNLTNAFTFNGVTVTNGNSFPANLNGPIILAATSTFELFTTGNMSIAGVMSGPGGLTKLGRGQGPLVITGSNTFTGPVTVNDGSVQVSSLNSVTGGTPTSALGAPTTVVNSTLSLGSGQTPGSLIYTGNGETTDRVIKLAGTTGGAIISQAGYGNGNGFAPTRGTSGLLKFTGNVSIPGIAGQDNRKTLILAHIGSSAGINVGQGEISGDIGDSLLGNAGQVATSVTKAGRGAWVLSGTNTYTGTTCVEAGTLVFTHANSLGGGALDITTGGKVQLDYIGTRQIATLTFDAGAPTGNGTYGSSLSWADNKDDVHFAGLGTVTVGPITTPTTTTLARTNGTSPCKGGMAVTFTAKIAGAAPTGKVIFYDGLSVIGTSVLNGSFQASVTTGNLSAATHAITALYVGNTDNTPSFSAALSQIVNETRPATTTTLVSDANPSNFGSAVTFTAAVKGASPRGTVTFYDGTTALGSVALSGATARFTTSSLAAGWRRISAEYVGDATNRPSTSTPVLFQTVNPPAGNGKLKVFILAGQSNMVGYGSVEDGRDPNNLTGAKQIPGGLGSLRHMLNKQPDKYSYLTDPNNPIAGGSPGWITRSDVWITYYGGGSWELSPNKSRRNGNLDANYGADAANGLIGPEYGFGLVVGSQLADQVLIIKYAHGGRSLGGDFRPPSSGGTVGLCYTDLLGAVHKVLNNIAAEFPAYSGGGYELVGLGWHQGWNDRCSPPMVAEYETNMVNLIKDLRAELKAPNLRVSIVNTGMAEVDSDVNAKNLVQAQANVANPTLHPEFAGTVATVDARPFDYGELSGVNNQGYHWYWNGESYFNIGESMGQAMVKLLEAGPDNTLQRSNK